MDIVSSILKLFFGSKTDKDRKQIEPYVNKIKEIYPSIEKLSNDELRARSASLMKQIADFIAQDEAHIEEQKARLELAEISLNEKEKVSKDIENTKKRIDEKIEQKLDEILPEAFAIMKDTARRFTENEVVEVTANAFDRNLAASKDFVTIEGDKAIYATHWTTNHPGISSDVISKSAGVTVTCSPARSRVVSADDSMAAICSCENVAAMAAICFASFA